jgi:hypothetical protein
MDACCPTTDFVYPMKADLYYAQITQNSYGQAQKEWVYDRTIICNAANSGSSSTKELNAEVFIQNDGKLIARTKSDPRVSSYSDNNAITNILITNIRDASDVLVYKETAGPRSGKGTIYEIATVNPFSGPFGTVEHYNMLWRRTESQAVGD